jgi:N-methylhydantoinase B
VVNRIHTHPGIAGGHNGAPDRCVINGTVEVAPSVANLLIETGNQLVYEFGGGGGWGDPLDRDPQAVLDDVWDEYVSVEGALRDYGVVLAGSAEDMTLSLDEEATAAERKRRRR